MDDNGRSMARPERLLPRPKFPDGQAQPDLTGPGAKFAFLEARFPAGREFPFLTLEVVRKVLELRPMIQQALAANKENQQAKRAEEVALDVADALIRIDSSRQVVNVPLITQLSAQIDRARDDLALVA